MLSGKILFALIGLTAAVLAVCNLNVGKPVVENWWGAGNPSFGVRAIPAAKGPDGQATALGVSVLNPQTMGSGSFFQVPNFQAVLSPRMSNVQYGANIRYNMPSRENMAVPCDPLTFGDMAQENFNPNTRGPVNPRMAPGANGMQGKFPRMHENRQPQRETSREDFCASCGPGQCGGGCPPSCGKGGYGISNKVGDSYGVPPSYAEGNYWDVYDKIPPSVMSAGSELPVGTMSSSDGAGDIQQVVTYNQLNFVNKKSRLWGLGDMIRGDLPITPCNTGWFSVAPDLAQDLNAGAMGVLSGAGAGGEVNNQLLQLLVQSTGGVKSTFGGVDISEINPRNVNMNAQSTMQLKAGMGDVVGTEFP
jgi:hypothetical protein